MYRIRNWIGIAIIGIELNCKNGIDPGSDNTCCAIQEGEELMRERPDLSPVVQPKLDELNQQWQDLEDTTKQKGQKLFDANRHILYEQSCDDIDGWINEIESQIVTEDVGHDLTTVNLLVKKQNVSILLIFWLLLLLF